METHESFRAMDTDIDVFIETPDAAPPASFIGARLLFEQQEERFSRFRPQSMLCRLNDGEVIDHPWFARAVSMAIDAFELTGGMFNPMVLPALQQAGYSGTFAEVATGGVLESQRVPDPKKVLRINGLAVELLAGQMDLGGIVKGWTADLAVEQLAEAHGNAFVNAGGDIRSVGSDGKEDLGWAMDVALPGDTGPAWAGRLRGGIATSTILKRRWTTADGGEAHHLIDPGTGMPSESPFVQVTARADACWLAEVWAKAVLIGGHETLERARRADVPVLAFDAAGTKTAAGKW